MSENNIDKTAPLEAASLFRNTPDGGELLILRQPQRNQIEGRAKVKLLITKPLMKLHLLLKKL